MIMGFTHAAVRVIDIDKSLEFYCGVLGLPEKFRLYREDGSLRLVYLKVAERQFIELFPGASGPFVRPESAAVVHICFEVDDIQAIYRQLSSRGVATNGEPKTGDDGSLQFWTQDPDGYPIEFHQFTPQSRQIA